MSDFDIDLPEPVLSEEQMQFRYSNNGGIVFDPQKQAFRLNFEIHEWYSTFDNVTDGNCEIVSNEFAIWKVTLWYHKPPGNSDYQCIEGFRESIGFYRLCYRICKEGRELVTTRSWKEYLPMHEIVKQRFRYLKEDGEEPDTVWRTVTD